MNSVTMMFFVVCLSGILLMAPSNNASLCHYQGRKIMFEFYDSICQKMQEEETKARRVNSEATSKPERMMKVASLTTTDKNDKPDSPVAPQEPPSSPGSRKKDADQSTVSRLTDDQSLDSSGEEPTERGMVGGGRRRRSINLIRDRLYNHDPSPQCCFLGCTREDMYEEHCGYRRHRYFLP